MFRSAMTWLSLTNYLFRIWHLFCFSHIVHWHENGRYQQKYRKVLVTLSWQCSTLQTSGFHWKYYFSCAIFLRFVCHVINNHPAYSLSRCKRAHVMNATKITYAFLYFSQDINLVCFPFRFLGNLSYSFSYTSVTQTHNQAHKCVYSSN